MDKQNQDTDVFAYSPYHMYLFKKALRKGKEKDRRIRINIVGNYGQGKTCLAKRLAGLTCDGVQPTNGIDINVYKCKSFTGKKQIERIDDEEQFFISRMASVARSISKDTSTMTNNVLGTSPLGPAETAKRKKDRECKRSSLNKKKLKTVTFDMRRTETIIGEASATRDEQKTFIVESSSNITELKSFADEMETGENDMQAVLEFWDFGGQFVFYATHSLFHSRKAIYLLVFDLSAPLGKPVKDEDFLSNADEKTMEYYAKFWMESIHYFVGPEPPVILVGTHKDKLDGDEQEKLAAKDAFFDNIRHLFDGTELIKHIQEEDYAIANLDSSEADVHNLLQGILKKGIDLTESSEIPARWIPLEKRLCQEKHKKIISFKRVREINRGNDCQLADDEELKLFLLYHHEKGSLFYFDEESISEHVVLDPKYLVDAFKCVITSRRFLAKNLTLRKELNSLMTKGKLKTSLIDQVWSDKFREHKYVLLEFLKKHYIISQIVEYNVNDGTCLEKEWYIVPSLLKDHSPLNNELLLEFLHGKSQTQIRFVMQFESPEIVLIIYHRLLAASLGKWPVVKLGKAKMLFRNLCVLQLGCNSAGIIEMKGSSIELHVSNLCGQPVECYESHRFRRFVETIVTHESRKMKSEDDNKVEPYFRKYRCNHSKHGLEGSHSTRDLEQLESTNFILCPDNYSHQEFNRSRANAEWFLQKPNQEVFPKVSLCDKSLSKLAGAVGENWELLAPVFSLSRIDIDHIKEDNSTTIMRIYSMLLKWKDGSEESATLDVFAEHLKSCPNLSVDWDVVKCVKEDFTTRSQSEDTVSKVTECASGSNIQDRQGPVKFIRTLTDRLVQKMPCTVDFECELSKDLPVQWYHNAHAIEHSNKYTMIDEGTRHKLEIRDVCSKDEGKYYVNAAGQKSVAELTVEETEEEEELRRLAENMEPIKVAKSSQRNEEEKRMEIECWSSQQIRNQDYEKGNNSGEKFKRQLEYASMASESTQEKRSESQKNVVIDKIRNFGRSFERDRSYEDDEKGNNSGEKLKRPLEKASMASEHTHEKRSKRQNKFVVIVKKGKIRNFGRSFERDRSYKAYEKGNNSGEKFTRQLENASMASERTHEKRSESQKIVVIDKIRNFGRSFERDRSYEDDEKGNNSGEKFKRQLEKESMASERTHEKRSERQKNVVIGKIRNFGRSFERDRSYEELESLFSEHFGPTPSNTRFASQLSDSSDGEESESSDDTEQEVQYLDNVARQYLDKLGAEHEDSSDDSGNELQYEGATIAQNDPDLIKDEEKGNNSGEKFKRQLEIASMASERTHEKRSERQKKVVIVKKGKSRNFGRSFERDRSYEKLESLFSEHFGPTPSNTRFASQLSDSSDGEESESSDDTEQEVQYLDNVARQYLDNLGAEHEDSSDDSGNELQYEGATIAHNDPDLIKDDEKGNNSGEKFKRQLEIASMASDRTHEKRSERQKKVVIVKKGKSRNFGRSFERDRSYEESNGRRLVDNSEQETLRTEKGSRVRASAIGTLPGSLDGLFRGFFGGSGDAATVDASASRDVMGPFADLTAGIIDSTFGGLVGEMLSNNR